MRKTRMFAVAGAAVVAVALTGCATQYTGGGTMGSATGAKQANIAIAYKLTDASTGAGLLKGTYSDGPVKLRFDNTPSDGCNASFGMSCADFTASVCNGDATCIAFFESQTAGCIYSAPSYISTSKTSPGSGQLLLGSCDSNASGGPSLGDTVYVEVISGPYNGYVNESTLNSGSFTAK